MGEVMTKYIIEWWDKDQWQSSYGYLTITDEAKARELLQQDKAYFYQRIKIRLIRWEGTVLEETTGTQ
jgi:hypothetical protein